MNQERIYVYLLHIHSDYYQHPIKKYHPTPSVNGMSILYCFVIYIVLTCLFDENEFNAHSLRRFNQLMNTFPY